jgi:hypothetical protein
VALVLPRPGSEELSAGAPGWPCIGLVLGMRRTLGNRGFVSGRSEILRKARAAREGDTATAAELQAAKALRAEGLHVHFRTAAGDAGVRSVRTSDFLVGGAPGTGAGGIPFEVFSPTTSNVSRLVGQLAKKLAQADRFVLGLSRTSVGLSELANLITRINNIPGIPRPVQEVMLVRDGQRVGHLRW